ncbi:hypothetical protein AZI86_09355 [Bdellovibrio bacteriovorus]|uniref:Lipoprotein n=1 Tax=Bdellovibrio bacteriovorus TaxID=959 RepID=A0A150WSM9_BDEBC|nr:hypothetical protein [Bdellovibrio bacteriovorus]KYG67205.1 hypothetical protein AZI86_09355 [Bdellovibrio bacteriovorus]
MNLKNTLLALLVMGGMLSCVKAPESEDVDTTPEAVLESVSELWGTADPFALNVNEFAAFETTQKVETNPNPFFTLREGITVKERVDSDQNGAKITRYKFNYQFDMMRGEEQTPQSTKEAQRGYCRGACSAAVADNQSLEVQTAGLKQKSIHTLSDDSNMILGFERAGYLASTCFNDEEEQAACVKEGYDSCERKCVNLKSEEIMRAVPQAVMDQPNCGGYKDCKWLTKTLSFDLIQTYKKGSLTETLRASFWATFTPELPFMARLTDFCIRQLVTIKTANPSDPMNGRKVLVNNCNSLTNYKPAPLPTP